MAIHRLKELKDMGKEDLDKTVQELETELSRERGFIASGTKAQNPGRIKEMRKVIARIKTIQKERGAIN